jgi:hypothetical protein
MTNKEVMQLALDNLIDVRDEDGIDCVEAILKLRAALAQPKREWQGLTDEQVDDIGCDFATLGGDIDAKDWFAFYLAIEAKLKEKNT